MNLKIVNIGGIDIADKHKMLVLGMHFVLLC